MPLKTSNDDPRPANAPQPKGVHKKQHKDLDMKRDPEPNNGFPGANTPLNVTHPNKKAHGPATFVRGALKQVGLELQGNLVVSDVRITYTPVSHEMWVATMQQNPVEASVTLEDFHRRLKRAIKGGLEQLRLRIYKPCDSVHSPAQIKHHIAKLGLKNLEVTVR